MSDSEESKQVAQVSPSEFSAPVSKLSDRKLEALAKARAKKQEVVKRARIEKREDMLKNISDDYRHEVDHLVNERMAMERQKLDTEFAQWKLAFYEKQGLDPQPPKKMANKVARKPRTSKQRNSQGQSQSSQSSQLPDLPLRRFPTRVGF